MAARHHRQPVEITVLAGDCATAAMILAAHNLPLRSDVKPPAASAGKQVSHRGKGRTLTNAGAQNPGNHLKYLDKVKGRANFSPVRGNTKIVTNTIALPK